MGAQKSCDGTRTGFGSTISAALRRVVIERGYSDIALPLIEYGSRMGGSKTSQGEKQRAKHGVQMYSSDFKIEATVDARQRQGSHATMHSTKRV